MSGFPDDIPFFDEGPQDAQPRQGGGLAARAMAARVGNRPAPDYLAGLNAEQRLAVETTEGPVLVLAGAGTGKTRVLTTRIAHILSQGRAFPSQILAVTFTNKAAREMKHRIGVLVGEAVEGMPWLGTFHSIGVKLLRRHAELAGLRSDFTILDTDDQVRLVKQLIQAEGLDDKRWPARQFAQMIDGWKNKGLAPEEIAEGDARAFANGKGRELYRAYQDRLTTLNACDFGDLLCHPIRIFRKHPDVLKEYHRKFKYILVDEYQDTNTAQYMWLRLLAQRPQASRSADLPAEGRGGDRRPPDFSGAPAQASGEAANGRERKDFRLRLAVWHLPAAPDAVEAGDPGRKPADQPGRHRALAGTPIAGSALLQARQPGHRGAAVRCQRRVEFAHGIGPGLCSRAE